MRLTRFTTNGMVRLAFMLTGLCTFGLAGCAQYNGPETAYNNYMPPSYTKKPQYNQSAPMYPDEEYYGSKREATILDEVLVNAIAQIGKPYIWGGESRNGGFDCSGLIQYVLAQAGIQVPRTAYAQAMALPAVSRSQLRKGDLVFFNTMGAPFTHVGIYIGGGQFVSALNAHAGITVQSLRNPYWASRLDGIRRPMPPELLAMQSLNDHVLNR